MRKSLQIAALLAFASAPAFGNDDIPLYVSDARVQQANLTLPLDQILSDLSKRWGYSFIFDSRVTKGKHASPPDDLAPPDIALEKCLRTANLSLQKINNKTYAIKAAAPQSVPEIAGAVIASPMLVDAIIVTATAATPLAVGAPNILSIDEEALSLISAVTPSEVIYDLPQSFSTFTPANTMFLGALSGISLVDLRGLDPERTLTLVNGRRRTPTPGGNGTVIGVDVNALAEPFLARIEVIAAPGGATMGPDAVAGSVNFVMRKPAEGIEAGAQYGLSERGDAQEASIYAIAGGMMGGVEISGGVNVTSQDGLLGADRESTVLSWGLGSDGQLVPGFGGSLITPKGSLVGAILSNGEVTRFFPRRLLNGSGGFEPFGSPSQFFSPTATQQFIVPSDRIISFVSVSTETDSDVEIFMEGQFARTWNTSQLAPLPTPVNRGSDSLLGDAIAIDISHPTVPISVATYYATAFGGDAQSIIVERRFTELGPREQTNTRTYVDLAAGARLDRSPLSAELTYRYGRSGVINEQRNLLDRRKVDIALDSAACASTSGCEAIDLFRLGGISQQAADFLRAAPLRRRISLEEHEVRAVAELGIDGVFEDRLELTAGLDFRRERLKDQGHNPQEGSVIGAFLDDNPSGAVSTFEAFSTVTAPLLRSAVGDLDLSLAGRVSASSETSPAFNLEISPIYAPARGIEFFAQIHVGRRPPNIIELLSRGPALYLTFDDPCDPDYFAKTATVIENCSVGPGAVDPGFEQTVHLARTTNVGNPGLRPETIETQAYGVSIRPTDLSDAIPGHMKLSATWLSYRVENMVGEASFPVEECYASPGFSDEACGVNPFSGLPLIQRDPVTQQITVIGSLLKNRGQRIWRGIDLAFDYVAEPHLGPLDRVWVNALHTVALRSEQLGIGEKIPANFLGTVTDPKHVSRISIGGEVGPLAINAFLQRRSAVEVASVSGVDQRIPATVLADLTGRITIREGVVATFAVENLTDRIAPVVAFGSVGNTFPEYYDLIGRRFSIGIKAAF